MNPISRIKNLLSARRARQRFVRNGNTLGDSINQLYRKFHAECQQQSQIESSPADQQLAADLQRQGFLQLPPIDIQEISEKVRRHYESIEIKDGFAYADLDFAQTLAPAVFRALQKQVIGVLEAYYQSHFQPYWSRILHYSAGYEHPPSSSFGYHIDDNPRELLKVFFYLNDTAEANAAFRAFDYETSRGLIKRGFISSSEELRTASQALVSPELAAEKLKIFEGAAGTALIFDNNIVHKATPPREAYRDALVVEVYPASQPITEAALEKALAAKIQTDYPLDPYHNDLQ